MVFGYLFRALSVEAASWLSPSAPLRGTGTLAKVVSYTLELAPVEDFLAGTAFAVRNSATNTMHGCSVMMLLVGVP